MVLVCPNCGAQIRLWEKRCSHCGAPRPDDREVYHPDKEAVRRTTDHHAERARRPSQTPSVSPDTERLRGRAKGKLPPESGISFDKKHEDGCHECGGTGVIEGVLPADEEDPDRIPCNCIKGKCMYCKGTGVCPRCDGAGGNIWGPCPLCTGSGKCPYCGGDGGCPTCKGSGFTRPAWVPCPRCGGSGEKYPKKWRRGPPPDDLDLDADVDD